jgi:hypothetical protein
VELVIVAPEKREHQRDRDGSQDREPPKIAGVVTDERLERDEPDEERERRNPGQRGRRARRGERG